VSYETDLRGAIGRGRANRSVPRSSKILAQNGAILRNTLRILNRQIPGASNVVQNSETMCNSLGRELEIHCSIHLSYGRSFFAVVQRPRVCIIEADG